MALIYNRREFLITSAKLAVVVPALSGAGRRALSLPLSDASGSLKMAEQAFLNPPDGAWPWVYWYGSNGNITREGITADLEAMHRVGIRGVIYMEVDVSIPAGPVRFLSPEWREMMQHAQKEATRLGITLNVNNDAGWAGSGGPWITPELSMQVVVWSETALRGGQHFKGALAQPKTTLDYYRDIAVLAFPTPPGEGVRMADCSPKLTYGADRKSFDGAAKLIDGNPGTVALVPPPPPGQPQYLNIEFSEPFAAQALTVAVDVWDSGMAGSLKAELQVSEDGRAYRTIREQKLYWPVCSVNFPKVSVRYYRLVLTTADLSGNTPFGVFDKGIPIGEVELHAGFRIEDIPGKASYLRQDAWTDSQDGFMSEPVLPAEMVVHRDQIVDLTGKVDHEGNLDWDVPPGKWTVLRFGHTTTGSINDPPPKEGMGLECDRLSKKAIEAQFAALVEKLLADQAAVGAKSLTMTHIDSWECGSQNWTATLPEEFQKKYAYDLLPYLIVLTGRAVESREVSERFLWDLRRLIADMLLENYAGHMREIAHQHGLTLSIEGYGAGPLDEIAYAGRADVPMSEFWLGQERNVFNRNKEMACTAHVYGKPVLAAESFTSTPFNGKWQNHPFELKPLGDLAFTNGVNRFVMSMCTMQPWADRKPGMTTGPWGTHHERTNTWWEQSRAWHAYLARCQALLQMGSFVADVAYLGTENVPNALPNRESANPAMPSGYDFDIIPPEVLLKGVTTLEGRVLLNNGLSYRILALPPGRTMTPALLRKIKELVSAGAIVVGPRPVASPSLANYPQCDREVQQLAEELWGDCDGVSILENRCGDGKVMWGRTLGEVLGELRTPPDLSCLEATVGEEIRYIHRDIDGDDVYFVASGVPEARRFLCTFRVRGKTPELWWPDTGRTEAAALFRQQGEIGAFIPRSDHEEITIPLSLAPYGSVFVVFRANAEPLADHVVSVRREGLEISGLTPKVVPDRTLQNEFSTTEIKQATGPGYIIEAANPGAYELRTVRGRVLRALVSPLPAPWLVEGPWELEFPKGLGAPEHVTLERLISWTEHPDAGVKYFSGTATYRKRLEVPARMQGKNRALYLDLGRVNVIAEVKLNDRDLGILWKPPFRVDVTDILHAGVNELEVRVVNLWPNRLIGDEQLPNDCEWAPPGTVRNQFAAGWGEVLDHWPQWLLENKPSPTGRVAFTTWKHWKKDDPLLESGLLGPVRIIATARMHVE
jgi:alpha-L-rhamnosidase